MSPGTPRSPRRLWLDVALQIAMLGGLLYSLRTCMQYLDPYREQRETARKRSALITKRLGRHLELNEYEQLLAANVVNPNLIDVSLEDVSGLDKIVEDLELKVLYPMQRPDLYCTTLWRQTKGVLLYGPPGTGKTMLAKALAKRSQCFFLNITASTIMSKWLGDANRLVKAVFSLAAKLEPCIIFIDEVDAMLGQRGHQEHEAALQCKTEFMAHWEGIESEQQMKRVIVLGATNRPWCIDEAVLRRFSMQYEIGLPNAAQRKAILRSYLSKHNNEIPNAVDQALLLDTYKAHIVSATTPFTSPAPKNARSSIGAASASSPASTSGPQSVAGLGNGLGSGGGTAQGSARRVKAVAATHPAVSPAAAALGITGSHSGSSNQCGKGSGSSGAGGMGIEPNGQVGKVSMPRRGSGREGSGGGGSSASSSGGDVASVSGGSGSRAWLVPGPLDWVVDQTEGYSGSDLRELCSQAAQQALGEMLLQQRNSGLDDEADEDGAEPAGEPHLRCLTREDFEEALKMVKPATQKADVYSKGWSGPGSQSNSSNQGVQLADVLKLLALGMQQQDSNALD